MQRRVLARLLHRLGRRYLPALFLAQSLVAHVVVALGVLELTLFLTMSSGEFWALMGVGQGLMLLDNLAALRLSARLVGPVRPWLCGDRGPAATVAAWRALAALPADSLRFHRVVPLLGNLVPFCAFTTIALVLPAYGFLILVAGGLIALGYGATLRFLALEVTLRPLLEEVSHGLPDDFDLGRAGVPLRLKLLAGLPLINVITGVTVSALSQNGHGISGIGLSVAAALLVSFTVAFELTLLLARSILTPIDELRRATHQLASGDFGARVPVVSTDETGRLAQGFNEMAAGLEERERLREAFGAYVDPDVAEMVIRDGADLAGAEVEVTVLFLDIRDFTAFAESASAREVVTRLNDFYEQVVPVLLRHGGHANKFVGDGLLGVFGAPDRRPDHADRAVAAAREIAALVRERYRGDLRIGIGVNSGPVVAGTIGGGGRVEFTVIGDPVNTASRVEALTRETGDEILVTEATRCLLSDQGAGFEQRAETPLKGKAERVRVWAPAGAVRATRSPRDAMPAR
ncbi:MAG: adenylate cyclase [Solirubrobacteraceae bacterium]|jgi:class 3 adenylate cyclase|nr:adenylate cyclase [Solirubrobacteraceae bacterium]